MSTFDRFFTKNPRPSLEPLEESLDRVCRLATCQKPFKTDPICRNQRYCSKECSEVARVIKAKAYKQKQKNKAKVK